MNTRLFLGRIFTRFMRVFFFLLYQPMAWSYDFVARVVSWGRWKDWVLTVLPYVKGSQILEIGHGPGHLQVALQQKGVRTFGVDVSRQMGQQARKRILKRDFTPKLIRGYAQHMPFRDRIFDQIVATFPTEYIHSEETLREVYRTLTPGGTLLVLPAAWITGKRLADRGFATLFRVTGQSSDWNPEWLVPLKKAGFQPEVKMITRKTWALVIISAYKPG